MNQNYSNDNLSYSVSYGDMNSAGGTGTMTVGNVYDYYRDYWYPIYYPTIQYVESKVDKAFKIVKKLIDMKILKDELTVGKFIELVNEISKDL